MKGKTVSDRHSLRYFSDLTPEEQDTAVEILFKVISEDYESGKIELIDARSEEDIAVQCWNHAGAIAQDCTYIPDDGTPVVRL